MASSGPAPTRLDQLEKSHEHEALQYESKAPQNSTVKQPSTANRANADIGSNSAAQEVFNTAVLTNKLASNAPTVNKMGIQTRGSQDSNPRYATRYFNHTEAYNQ
jgi:hypothetical protein